MSCQKCVGALPAAGLSRRAVLNRFGLGLGGMALANLVNPTTLFGVAGDGPGPRRAWRAAPLPRQGQARDLPVHGRRAVADGDVRLQAGAQRSATASSCRTRCARASGSPACRATSRRCRWRARSSASASTAAQRHVGQRPAAAHRQGRRRPLHRPVDVHRRDQPRPGDHVLPDRLADRRAAQHGRVAALRPGQRQREPARVRRADHAGQGGPAALLAPVGQRVPAVAASGRAVPKRHGPGALPRESRRRLAREPAAAARPAEGPARARGRDARRLRGRRAHRAVRDGLSHAGQRARGDGRLERDRGDVRPVRPRRQDARDASPPTACWRAGWPSAA